MAIVIPDRVIERVRSKVAMGPNGCHLSTYSVASHGYAQVGWGSGSQRTVTLCHRVVWIAEHGSIPEEMTVDHVCPKRNRRCIRPSHLRLIPNLENARRTAGRDWPIGECINGHPDVEHWVPAKGKTRGHCDVCRKEQQQRYARKMALLRK